MPEIKLHLGCGKRYLPGYVHVDLAEYPHINHKHEVQKLPMFADSSVDLIYASHVIEYFDRIEVKALLKEWRRVMKKGAVLRLAAPDFEALARVYSESRVLDLIHGPLYGRWEIPGSDKVVYHKTVYDFDSLKLMLEEAGFRNVKRFDWRKVFSGELEGYDDYSQAYVPHLDKENGILISLNVEAEK